MSEPFPAILLNVVENRSSVRKGIGVSNRNCREMRVFMFAAYIIVTVLAARANIFAAASDFIRPQWLLTNMTRVRVPRSWLPTLAILKAAVALGLLVGIRVPLIGVAAALGLIFFFVGAIITHLRARLLIIGCTSCVSWARRYCAGVVAAC
jgi:xanthosine utilization system XapX-like protein